jgi:repressor LexA
MGRTKSKSLGERHHRILRVLEQFQKKLGYPPSIREIGEKASISSTSVVNYYLDQLEDWGYIERDGRVSRGIRLLKEVGEPENSLLGAVAETKDKLVQAVEDLLHVPLVGRIFASQPVQMPNTNFSIFEPEAMVDVARSMLPAREKSDNLFALEVQGDSMIDAMVNEGDIVIMRPAQDASNGEMVAVWLTDRDETTLKYFYRENGRIRLQPANPTMGPIYIDNPDSVVIQGKVVMVIRQVDTPVQ